MPPLSAIAGTLVSRAFAGQLSGRYRGRVGEADLESFVRRIRRWHLDVSARLGPASGLAALHDVGAAPLARLLGFSVDRIRQASSPDVLLSRLRRDRLPAMVLAVTPWSERHVSRVRAVLRSAAAHDPRWVIWFHGRQLRLLDPSRPLARRDLGFDLPLVVDDPAAIAVLRALVRAEAFIARPGGRSFIDEVVTASASHDRFVARRLQDGVRDALSALAAALRRVEPGRRTPASAIVEQSLTLVFRLLFLLFAEARALVPVWHPVYRHSYLVEGLRRQAEHERCDGLWEGLQAISRLAHEGCELDELRVTAFNGQLFSPTRTPLGEAGRVDNETMRRVLRSLTTCPDAGGGSREVVAYGDLDVEELGAIYERLLDASFEVERAIDRRTRPEGTRAPTRVSVRRKESGTFYTPREMAAYLVREALAPLVRDASAEAILALRVLDPAMGSGAFLVAACRFLAEAYEQALERDGRLPRGVALERARAGFRRLVAQRCLFGVDVNPAAAGLARLSLWLATLSADAPLTFLDHHLRVGNSLIGASVDDLARGWRSPGGRPRRLADRGPQPALPLVEGEAVTSLMRDLVPFRARLAEPDDRAGAVQEKDRALEQVLTSGALARLLTLADAWCAKLSWPAGPPPPDTAWADLTDHALTGRSALPKGLGDRWLDTARHAGAARRYFHWPLQFPEVFFAADGSRRADAGFDAIVGNPPWDMVRADVHDADLGEQSARDAGELARFVRASGVYEGPREGHVNRYQLFVERTLALVRPGGRVGLVAPWGLASDQSATYLRRRLLLSCDTESIIGFENADAIFPIHRSQRFLLLASTAGRPTTGVRCRLGARTLDVLDRPAAHAGPPSQPETVVVAPAFLRRVSGEGLELPWIRRSADVAVLETIDRHTPPLGSIEGWGARFGRELNATDDRRLFAPPGAGMPIVEGRHLMPFAVRTEGSERSIRDRDVPALLARLPGLGRSRLAYRDVSSPTNTLTLIAAVLPARVASTHTIFCLRTRMDAESQWCLCALLNSFVANYLVRLRITSHVTASLMAGLRVPTLDRRPTARHELASLARELAAARTASGAGYARVQALAARAYELTSDQFAYVVSTFPLVDARDRDAALAEFERLR
jgi:hypothetical protein